MQKRNVLLGLPLVLPFVLVNRAPAAAETFGERVALDSGYKYMEPLLDKLFVFKVGPKCAAKLPQKDDGAARASAYAARDVMKYAKGFTGDDWGDIEYRDRDKGPAMVAEMIEAFSKRFKMTVEVEGDDCDNTFGSRWTKYWTAITGALGDYGYDTPTLAISLKVAKGVKTISTVVSPDGTKIDFVVPRDIEPKAWDTAFAKPFRQRKSGFMNDFTFAVMVDTNPVAAKVLDSLFQFKVAPACAAKLPLPEWGARHAMSFATRDVMGYAKAVTGDDWDAIYAQSGDAAENKRITFEMIEDFKKKFAFVISVDGKDCDAAPNSMWLRYITNISTALENNPPMPKGKKVVITLNVTAKAKDVTVKAAKDGSSIVFTAPSTIEAPAWSDKLAAPFKKFPRK